MNSFAIISAINFAVITFLAALVFFSNTKNRINQTYSLANLSVSFWSFFYVFWQISNDYESAYRFLKLLMYGAAFMPVFLFHFIVEYTNRSNIKKAVLPFVYLIGCLFVILISRNQLFDHLSVKSGFPFWPNAGPALGPFIMFFFLIIVFSMYLLWRYYCETTGLEKEKTKYLFIGLIIAIFAGSPNYALWYDIPLTPVLNPLFSVYVGIIAYAILTKRLMDIRIIIKKGLVYAIVTAIISALYIAIVTGAEMAYKNMPYYNVLWLTIPSILLLAVIFAPLIEIVQNAVERTVFKKQYLANQVAMRFSEGIKELMDIDELSKYITRSAIKVFKLKGAAVFIVNEETKKYECRDARGDLISFRNSVFNESDLRISAIKNAKTTLVADEMQEGQMLSLMRKEGVSVLVPSISAKNGSLIGFLIGSDRSEARIFSEEDIYLLDSFGSQSSLSIENALMYRAQINEIERSIKGSRMSDLGAAAAGVAHEAKNALVSIYAVSQMLSEKKDDPSFLEKTKDLVSSEVERMKILMEGVINYSEPAPLSIERQDLKQMVEATALLVRDIAKGKNISLVIGQDCSRFVNADRNTMKQVFLNLFLNAIEAIGKDGTITVCCQEAEGSKVRVIFKDTGPGIPPGKIKKILEPFFTTKEQGTGLGLAIVKKSVEANGGSLSIESKPGEGASFIISLERG